MLPHIKPPQEGPVTPMLPDSFAALLVHFGSCFTHPSFSRFMSLMTGWLLCTGKHTVTGVMRAAGVVGKREHSGFHRFFSRGAWHPDAVGLVLLRLVLAARSGESVVTLAVDDTLARHTGKHIASAGMHHDPLLSSAHKPFWHFGHNWVVVAVVLHFPRWNKSFSLPVLFRLSRTEKVNQKLGLPHRKRTELAAEILALIARTCPKQPFLVVADNGYVNRAVVRSLPDSMQLIGRGRMDAALYAPPPQLARRRRGRPAVKGRKLASPQDRSGAWTCIDASIYGRTATVKVKVFDALWYRVAHGRKLRFVVIRDWPGHRKDDVLVTTNLELDAAGVIELYCLRWTLEETFHWAKDKLGFEEPHNRTEHAVQRTAPMALWAYSLTILWYRQWSLRRTKLPMRSAPWYKGKAAPSFADMLATLRQQSWILLISDQANSAPLDQKKLEPLLDAVAYG